MEADVVLEDGTVGRASVPSGASKGRYEAHERRDGDPARFAGLGVFEAVGAVRGEIAAFLVGRDALAQQDLDRGLAELDGSPQLGRLGANAVLATSLAVARAAASHVREPMHRYVSRLVGGTGPSLPMPMANVLSGGAHLAGGLDFQDFLVVPIGAGSFSEAAESIFRVARAAGEIARQSEGAAALAEDGGYATLALVRAEQALERLVRAIERAGLRPGLDVGLALDLAASEHWDDGRYRLAREGLSLSSEELGEHISSLVARFPLVAVEDVFEQDDFEAWRAFVRRHPDVQVVGDDLFATNAARVREGIEGGLANSALVKATQNGTLSGTLEVVRTLRAAGWGSIVAGRSGDTEDPFVADLAVGTGAGQIKIGAFRNSERLSKYNQLLRIEEDLDIPFAGAPRVTGRGAPARS